MSTRLLAFDLEAGGHHASYLQYLVEAAVDAPGVALSLGVTPDLPRQHRGLESAAAVASVPIVHASPRPVAPRLTARLRGPLALASHALAEWRSLTECAAQTGSQHAIAMYIDRLLMPLALGLRAPCPVSGIYFRPTFHYGELSGDRGDLRERLRAARQLALVRRALRNPTLHTLFCLDPFAVEHLQRLGPDGRKAQALADPVGVPPVDAAAIERLRVDAGIEPRRRVALLFGVITTRKGVVRALRAVEALPHEAARTLAVAIVGKVDARFRDTFEAAVASARASSPAQIVVRDAFVPDGETPVWFALADVVLAPYEHHVGSSGIVIRAAAGRRPTLADGYGLVGAQVRQFGLGRAVDTAVPATFAAALGDFLADPSSIAVDPAAQARFADSNRPESFTRALLGLPRRGGVLA